MERKSAKKAAAAVAAKPKPARVHIDPLSIPSSVGKRFFMRSGCIRIGKTSTVPMTKICKDLIGELVMNGMRASVLDGRSTIRTRDTNQALEIADIRIYWK